MSLVWSPVKWVWAHSALKVYDFIPAKMHKPSAALVTVAVFLVGTMVPEETGDNTRANRAVSLFGLVVMIALLTATSRDWRKIPWHTVIGGMLTQFIIAVFVLRTQVGYDIFDFISFLARTLLGFAEDGVTFLTSSDVSSLTWFLISVIPAIIFFVALVQLLYHVGLIQWFIGKFAICEWLVLSLYRRPVAPVAKPQTNKCQSSSGPCASPAPRQSSRLPRPSSDRANRPCWCGRSCPT